jgi:hypothetical protein
VLGRVLAALCAKCGNVVAWGSQALALSLGVMYSRPPAAPAAGAANDDPRAHACVHAIVPANNGIIDFIVNCHESIGSGIPPAEAPCAVAGEEIERWLESGRLTFPR